MRITSTYLKKWLQKEFDRLGIDLVIQSGYATRYTEDQYQWGATYYVFRVGLNANDPFYSAVYCFLPRRDIESALANGHELCFKLKDREIIDGSEISYRKKEKPVLVSC